MKRQVRCAALLALAGLPAMLRAPAAQAAAAHGPIAVARVQFYPGKHFHANPCTPAGRPASTFRSTVKRIYTYVEYTRWNGRHKDQFRWYAPDGRLYAHDRAVPYTGHGPTADCNWLAIRGFRAARLPGRWIFRLVVDGRVTRTVRFRLVR